MSAPVLDPGPRTRGHTCLLLQLPRLCSCSPAARAHCDGAPGASCAANPTEHLLRGRSAWRQLRRQPPAVCAEEPGTSRVTQLRQSLRSRRTPPPAANRVIADGPTEGIFPLYLQTACTESLAVTTGRDTHARKRVFVHAQTCPILCNPMGCSPPGSSIHGIPQGRILEWVAMPSSSRSS